MAVLVSNHFVESLLACSGSLFPFYLGSMIYLGSDWPGMERVEVLIGNEAKEHGIKCLGFHALFTSGLCPTSRGMPLQSHGSSTVTLQSWFQKLSHLGPRSRSQFYQRWCDVCPLVS